MIIIPRWSLKLRTLMRLSKRHHQSSRCWYGTSNAPAAPSRYFVPSLLRSCRSAFQPAYSPLVRSPKQLADQPSQEPEVRDSGVWSSVEPSTLFSRAQRRCHHLREAEHKWQEKRRRPRWLAPKSHNSATKNTQLLQKGRLSKFKDNYPTNPVFSSKSKFRTIFSSFDRSRWEKSNYVFNSRFSTG